jgi:hypothetical protein
MLGSVSLYHVLIIISVIALAIAFLLGKRWEQKNPSKLGFKWGYFFICQAFLVYGLVFLKMSSILFTDGSGEVALVVAGLGVVLVVMTKAFQRRSWALVLTTLLSLNILWIVINFFYLRNRWSEFAEERAERLGLSGAVEQSVGKVSKSWRLAFFGAVVWVLAVALFVFLLEPYGGYMNDDEMLHMLSVVFMPAVLALALFWLYERYVR